MERNKYIAAIVLGFLAILAIGVVSIKLFRAKRSTAPEHEAMLSVVAPTPTPTASPRATNSELLLEVPRVTDTAPLDSAAVPEAVVKYMGQERAGVVVQSVTFEGGRTGVKVERDLSIGITALNDLLRAGVTEDRTLLAYKTSPRFSEFAFRSVNPAGRVVVNLTQKSETVTTFSAYLIFE